MSAGDVLETPTLLIAMPQVLDPFFHRSLVLLIHHDDEGSFGFILNRTTGIRVSEILAGMEIEWKGDAKALAHFGGPVQPQLGSVLLLSLLPDRGLEAASPVMDQVDVTQHVGDLEKLAESPPDDFRLFLGYSGWGAGQLMDEIQRDDWLIAPVSKELLFSADPDLSWEQALAGVGIDPASLPSWSHGSSSGENDESAN